MSFKTKTIQNYKAKAETAKKTKEKGSNCVAESGENRREEVRGKGIFIKKLNSHKIERAQCL